MGQNTSSDSTGAKDKGQPGSGPGSGGQGQGQAAQSSEQIAQALQTLKIEPAATAISVERSPNAGRDIGNYPTWRYIYLPPSRHYKDVEGASLSFHKMVNDGLRDTSTHFNSFITSLTCGPSSPVKGPRLAFISSPILPGQGYLVQIGMISESPSKVLGIGFTSRDPATLRWDDLPHHDLYELLERRRESWLWDINVGNSCLTGDEFCVLVQPSGQVSVSKNGQTKSTIMNVDMKVKLWPFFILFPGIFELQLLGKVFDSNDKEVPKIPEICSLPSNTITVPKTPLESPLSAADVKIVNTSQILPQLPTVDKETKKGDVGSNQKTSKPVVEPPAELPVQKEKRLRPLLDSPVDLPVKQEEVLAKAKKLALSGVVQFRHLKASRFYSNVDLHSLGFENFKGNSGRGKPRLPNTFKATFQPNDYINGYAFLNSSTVPKGSRSMVVKMGYKFDNGQGALGIGFTSVDPKHIDWATLPNHSLRDFKNIPGLWAWDTTMGKRCDGGDEFYIRVESSGDVFASKNGGVEKSLMWIDNSETFWPFFVLLGTCIEIMVLGTVTPPKKKEAKEKKVEIGPKEDQKVEAISSSALADRVKMEGQYQGQRSEPNLVPAPVELDILKPPDPIPAPINPDPPIDDVILKLPEVPWNTRILLDDPIPSSSEVKNRRPSASEGKRDESSPRSTPVLFDLGSLPSVSKAMTMDDDPKTRQRVQDVRRPKTATATTFNKESSGEASKRCDNNRGHRVDKPPFKKERQPVKHPGYQHNVQKNPPRQQPQTPPSKTDKVNPPAAKDVKGDKEKVLKKNSEPKKSEESKSLCLICCEEPTNCVFLRCGHLCMCLGCATKCYEKKNPQETGADGDNATKGLQELECPICRGQGPFMRIYAT